MNLPPVQFRLVRPSAARPSLLVAAYCLNGRMTVASLSVCHSGWLGSTPFASTTLGLGGCRALYVKVKSPPEGVALRFLGQLLDALAGPGFAFHYRKTRVGPIGSLGCREAFSSHGIRC